MTSNQTFSSVTETPDNKATQEQIERAYSRYRFALEFCRDKDVLEVACGSGLGLGYIAGAAKTVTGGDIDEKNLAFAKKTYAANPKINVQWIDAQALPFSPGSFDTVILYEAIYYLPEPEKFIREAGRVLRNGGRLLICTVNKEWPDFNPSPYSRKYFSSAQLKELLEAGGLADVRLFGANKVEPEGPKDKLVSLIKRLAVALHIMPKTMKGKQLLKRIFLGRLYPMPAEIREGMSRYEKPVELPPSPPVYKIIYAVASKK